jgi:5-amino-6-(5-phosphoribosylamino)uracil reductase
MHLTNHLRTTIILAMSADGKIAAVNRAAARFGSPADKAHLEAQVAQADAVLFGASTLRAYGSALRITRPELLHQRQQHDRPPQPVQIVCARSANFDPDWVFFHQPLPRWLLTTPASAQLWQQRPEFDRVLAAPSVASQPEEFDWNKIFQQFAALGIQRLAILGGGSLISSLFAFGLIDEMWLTVCPLVLGGTTAPTPVAGSGFLETTAPQLQLLEVRTIDHEVFLHYRILNRSPRT